MAYLHLAGLGDWRDQYPLYPEIAQAIQQKNITYLEGVAATQSDPGDFQGTMMAYQAQSALASLRAQAAADAAAASIAQAAAQQQAIQQAAADAAARAGASTQATALQQQQAAALLAAQQQAATAQAQLRAAEAAAAQAAATRNAQGAADAERARQAALYALQSANNATQQAQSMPANLVESDVQGTGTMPHYEFPTVEVTGSRPGVPGWLWALLVVADIVAAS